MYGKNIERARGIAPMSFRYTLDIGSYIRSWENRNTLIEQSTNLIKHSFTSYACNYSPLHQIFCNVSITELKVELYRASLIENLFYKLSVF